MTEQEIAAIAESYRGEYSHRVTIEQAIEDIQALLAEIERLRSLNSKDEPPDKRSGSKWLFYP